MAVTAPALQEALADITGRDHLLRDPVPLAAHAVDGVTPAAVIRPGSGEEVGRVLALCAGERLALVARGSGRALALGNPPRRLDVVLDTGRLRTVRDYVPEDMVATVEAGVTLDALAAHLAPHRQTLALDPPGGGPRSIGGVLATHASGPLRFRYGTGRDLLLGVRFVQADGTLTWGGAKVVKSVTGYDIPKLLVGSLGTLGVIIEATLRLHPVPPASRSWRVGFPSADAARAGLAALLDSSLQPDRAALLDAAGLSRAGLPPDAVSLLVGVSSVLEAVESQGQALAQLARSHGGHAEVLPDAAWQGLGATVAAPVLLRLVAEPSRLLDGVVAARTAAARVGASASMLAQPGHGVLQLALWDVPDPARLSRDLILPLRSGLEAEGGSLVVERAPLELKASCEVWGAIDPETLEIMSRIKREFDPDGVLAPGRFVGGL